MPLPACRYTKLDQVAPYRHLASCVLRRPLRASLILLACVALGCGEASRATNANLSGGSSPRSVGNANGNTNPRTPSSEFASIDIKEPERYSVAMTISSQENASVAPAPMLTQQVGLAKLGADRRWAFLFPAPLGQIVYLEKSGLKYLVLFERNQYAELSADAIGFQLGNVLLPHSIAERLKTGQFEKLGLEPINGRTGIKYRVTAAAGASTQTGGVIFVDQETGLPLRSELNAAAPSGTQSRVIVEVRDVQLNPDRAQFDVPVGMKKVTQQEASQHIEGFASALRTLADIISGTRSAPVARVSQSTANKNRSRGGR